MSQTQAGACDGSTGTRPTAAGRATPPASSASRRAAPAAADAGAARREALEAGGVARPAAVGRVPVLPSQAPACVCDILPEQHGAPPAQVLAPHGAGALQDRAQPRRAGRV